MSFVFLMVLSLVVAMCEVIKVATKLNHPNM